MLEMNICASKLFICSEIYRMPTKFGANFEVSSFVRIHLNFVGSCNFHLSNTIAGLSSRTLAELRNLTKGGYDFYQMMAMLH